MKQSKDSTAKKVRTNILFRRGDSINPAEVTATSEKNKNSPNAKINNPLKKYTTASGVALPGAETVGGTLPVPI
ncbi:MAG: hypothetical protein J5852_02240 [Clostridia bacterium]|nr:hypothetical protein [Clostridia bacterium]